MTHESKSSIPNSATTTSNPYLYGWREVRVQKADGSVDWEQVPLTLEEVLHPQEGYTIVQSNRHEFEFTYLGSVLRARLAGNPHALVLCDCLIDWQQGYQSICPDVAVFFGMDNPGKYISEFKVRDENAQPVVVIEIVSPHTRENDVVKKLPMYHQGGVPHYIIVDQQKEQGPRQLIHYQRGEQEFQRMPLEPDGSILLDYVSLKLMLRNERVVCVDAHTGEKIGDYTEVYHLAQDEAQARKEAEQKRLDEERARKDAEQKVQEVERKRLEEERARKDAEQKHLDEERARKDAEQKAQEAERKSLDEEQKRLLLEQRLREVEEKLRLQGRGA